MRSCVGAPRAVHRGRVFVHRFARTSEPGPGVPLTAGHRLHASKSADWAQQQPGRQI